MMSTYYYKYNFSFQAPTYFSELTCHAKQVVNNFLLAQHHFWLAQNKIWYMLERHVLFMIDLIIWKPFSFQLCCIVCIFLVIWAIYCIETVFRKSACLFGQVKTKMYPRKPFFQKISCRCLVSLKLHPNRTFYNVDQYLSSPIFLHQCIFVPLMDSGGLSRWPSGLRHCHSGSDRLKSSPDLVRKLPVTWG